MGMQLTQRSADCVILLESEEVVERAGVQSLVRTLTLSLSEQLRDGVALGHGLQHEWQSFSTKFHQPHPAKLDAAARLSSAMAEKGATMLENDRDVHTDDEETVYYPDFYDPAMLCVSRSASLQYQVGLARKYTPL